MITVFKCWGPSVAHYKQSQRSSQLSWRKTRSGASVEEAVHDGYETWMTREGKYGLGLSLQLLLQNCLIKINAPVNSL